MRQETRRNLLPGGASVLRYVTPTGLLCFGGNLYERDVRDLSATAVGVSRWANSMC